MKTFFILFFFPIHLAAQDLTGLWSGSLYTSGNELPYELVISRTDDKLTGYSLTTFIIDGLENAGLKSMKIKNKNGKVIIEDDELIQDNYSVKPKRMMLYSVLSITGEDSNMILSGNFNTRAYNNANYKGTIILKKKKDECNCETNIETFPIEPAAYPFFYETRPHKGKSGGVVNHIYKRS